MTLPDDGGLPFPRPQDLRDAIEHLRSRWAWFVGFGVLCALFGVAALALVGTATIAFVYLIALFMIVVGGTEIVVGVNSHLWSSRFLLVLIGLLYVVTGSFALANPLTGAAAFTLLLGASLFATGLVRIYFGVKLPHGPSGFVILAGAITTLLGMFILFGWPQNSPFILGLLLGVDLLFYGCAWIGFGLMLRSD
ncbi:MAG: DUF308 domain-containing protein [Methylocystis sp.]|nr:DUF308 domain-containing protein [Methylocystis sp.]